MDSRYRIADTSQIITPALVVFRELLEDNLRRMIEIAKRPERLRPHCKTHKTREIARMELELGIVKHKCAMFAEAEMLASVGIKDIFLAYNLVGPNVRCAVEFVKQFPEVTLSVTADHPRGIASLGEALDTAGCRVDVLLDINVGQHRTGVPVGSHAAELYRQIAATRGLNPGGFHVYDGHQHQLSRDERRVAVLAEFDKVRAFRDNLVASGQTVPRMVCGGTASFPIYAEIDDPTIELSPGTCVLNDVGYSEHFPDLVFPPAAVMLTRVVSRPAADRITLDLGYKAVASDPPAGQRDVSRPARCQANPAKRRTPRVADVSRERISTRRRTAGDSASCLPDECFASSDLRDRGGRACRSMGSRLARSLADDLSND